MKGERVLPVDRETAWKELNDAATLKAAVPGSESFVPAGDNAFETVVNASIGPVKARFKGRMRVTDAQPPEAYTVEFDLQGGPMGFSRGQARVTLATVGPHETRMAYTVQATVGGKLAQVGSRLVDAGAATMAEQFFAAFAAQLAAKYPPAAGGPAVAPRPPGLLAMCWAFLRRLLGLP